jgi:hypothetical protein
MAKIRIRSGRGTKIIEVDDDATKWTGEEFKKIQASRNEAAKNVRVSSGRGTGTRKLGDISAPRDRPEYKGTMSSGRGTGSRKKKE